MNQLLKVEFHCHTIYSKDSLNRLPDLLAAARRKGIDRLVITDHNRICGAVLAQQLDPELVIVGEEIMTRKGELLAAYVTEEVPPHLPPEEAIARLRAQGAFISVSHPFDRQRAGWDLVDLQAIMPLVDAVEVFNARCTRAVLNEQAQAFAREHNLAGTVGSDAHSLLEVGRATLRLPAFAGPDELRAVIRQGTPDVILSAPAVHLTSVYARLVKRMFPRLCP